MIRMRTQQTDMTGPMVSYLVGVIGVAAGASLLALLGPEASVSMRAVAIWTVAALVGELMLFPTATGRAHINLATAVHLVLVLMLTPAEMVVVLWLSRSAAKLIIQRAVWYRALFNVAQATLAVLAAALVYKALGGPAVLDPSWAGLLKVAPAFTGAAVTYWIINTGLVANVIALTSGTTPWLAWRENYGYTAEIVSTAGLALFAPILVVVFQLLDWVGLLVFVFPLLLIRASSVRYIALRRVQEELISSERLAAKGEIAAEVGHEINNRLTAVFGQLQLMSMKDGEDAAAMQERLQAVVKELQDMEQLSRGLSEYAHRDPHPVPTRVTDLVGRTVDFHRQQNRFDEVEFRVDLDPRLGETMIDPAQIQQAVSNLLIHAADSVKDGALRRISVWARLHDVSGKVEITVADSGEPIPEKLRRRVLEPGFVPVDGWMGRGLATVRQIAANHDGSVVVGDSPSGGSLIRIMLPLRRTATAAAA